MSWGVLSTRWAQPPCSTCAPLPLSPFSLRGVNPGKRVAVLGSGDNVNAFALVGLGAERVTSVDISEAQIETGKARAEALGIGAKVRCQKHKGGG